MEKDKTKYANDKLPVGENSGCTGRDPASC